MFKKLSRLGNGFAIIIDKPILDLLTINKDTLLEVSTDGRRIIIEPTDRDNKVVVSKDPKVQDAFEKVMKKYAGAFRKLSNN